MTIERNIMHDRHSHYMQQALALAERGRLTVSPNPMVGCVIVNNDEVVGHGYHQRAGEAHAEVIALQAAGEKARGATMYVTLEPCAHTGKTPPCTQALIDAGIAHVYVACLDPNPLVAGKGIKTLRANGITVDVGLYGKEAIALNAIFFHYIFNRRPFVIAKWAMSLDGKTITHPLADRKISSPESHQNAHQLRLQVDAILVGAKTARQDNPQLNVRSIENIYDRQPLRIILSSDGNLPLDLHVLTDDAPHKTMIVVVNNTNEALQSLCTARGIEILSCKANAQGQIDLPTLLNLLGARGITSLLVEGGMTIHQQFFSEKLVNQVCVYLAPVILGESIEGQYLTQLTNEPIAQDHFFKAYVGEPSHV